MEKTKEFDLDWFNSAKKELGEKPIELKNTKYKYIKRGGTKGDIYTKEILDKILDHGCLDHKPRPYYENRYGKNQVKYNENTGIITLESGKEIELCEKDKVIVTDKEIVVHSPAHSLSINNEFQCSYDLSKGESPMITLRPIATRVSIAEIIWIYLMKSNDLVDFDKLLGKDTWDKDYTIHNWWLDWAIVDSNGKYILNRKGHPHIGNTYGETIRIRDMFNKEVIEVLKKDPDNRRIICSLWQIDDYKKPHGLKPCAFQTIWNVRHGRDGIDYLDMCLVQRSSDFCTAGCINQVQYASLLLIVAREVGLAPGVFTWKPANVQIYDRHIEQAIEMINRHSVNCDASIKLDDNVKTLKDVTPDSISILNNKDKQKIKEKNPQLKFQLGI